MRKLIYLALVMVGTCAVTVALANEDDGGYLEDLEALQQQLEAVQEGTQPQHPTSRERALEAQLAEMQHRAVQAEEALAVCRAEVTALKGAK